MENKYSYHQLGDTACLIRLGEVISPDINRQVHALSKFLGDSNLTGITGMIPAYADLTVIFDPEITSYTGFLDRLQNAVTEFNPHENTEIPVSLRILDIPVVYGGEYGPDIEFVARNAGLTVEEVIDRHSRGIYPIYMMGFTPGFCYLGGLDGSLHTPRKSEPRLKIPAGSVGIAGNQTGIYPIESPGGWQIIGRTPLNLFDPHRESPFLCEAGMTVRFTRLHTDFSPEELTGYPVPGKPEPNSFGGTIRVIDAGILTTLQDGGRPGYRAFGMPVSGAMDLGSLHLANGLVGNPKDEAVLEITAKGPVLEFLSDTDIALAGADLRPVIDGREVRNGQKIRVRGGQILSFSGLKSGLRTYLAVGGGFDVPLVMGSKSTYLRGKVGGFHGRALQAGDELFIGEPAETDTNPFLYNPKIHTDKAGIRVVKGPEWDRFTTAGQQVFLDSEFTVSQYTDRMGMRLNGPPVELYGGGDILSSGVIPGTIQVTGDGQPIILMNDCQTTGGYVRIGCVISEDLQVLAQLMPGQKLRFTPDQGNAL